MNVPFSDLLADRKNKKKKIFFFQSQKNTHKYKSNQKIFFPGTENTGDAPKIGIILPIWGETCPNWISPQTCSDFSRRSADTHMVCVCVCFFLVDFGDLSFGFVESKLSSLSCCVLCLKKSFVCESLVVLFGHLL